jgi:hypothetical protein
MSWLNWDSNGTPYTDAELLSDTASTDNGTIPTVGSVMQQAQSVAQQIGNFSQAVRDVTTSVNQIRQQGTRAYNQQVRNPSVTGDANANYFQRLWFYSSDMEKAMLAIGLAGIAVYLIKR